MDPNAAWLELAEAHDASDWDRCSELAIGLLEWIRSGGFPPTITGQPKMDQLIVRRVCIDWANGTFRK